MARNRQGGGVAVRLSVQDGETVRRALQQLGKEGEAALKRIERAGQPASRGLLAVDGAAKEVRGGVDRLAASAGPLGRVMTGLGPAGVAGAAGIGALGLALGSALRIARDAVAEFDRLGKAARDVGISTDLYQVLGFAALEEGLEGLDGALSAFTLRVGEAARGQGELATFLKGANPELLRQIQLARSQEERLRLLADAVRAAGSAEERAAISKAAFGRAGVDMVRILKEGSDGLDDFADRAARLGIIVDRSLIARAEELSNQLDVAWRVIDLNLKQAFLDLAPVVVAVARVIAEAAAAIRAVIDATRDIEERTYLPGLERRLADINRARDALNADIERIGRGELTFLERNLGTGAADMIARRREELRALDGEAARVLDRIAQLGQAGTTAAGPGGRTQEQIEREEAIARLREAGVTPAMRLAKAETHLAAALEHGEITREEYQRLLATARDVYAGAAGARDRAAEAAERERQRVEDLIAQIEFETAQLGLNAEAQEMNAYLRQAGAGATAEQTERLIESVRVLQDARRRQDEMTAAQQAFADAQRDVNAQLADSFIAVALRGEEAIDVLKRLVIALAEAELRAAFLGERGPLATLVGGLFGFGRGAAFAAGEVVPFARGGIVSAPTLFPMRRGAGLMGEAGPEAILPLSRGGGGRLGVEATGIADAIGAAIEPFLALSRELARSAAPAAAAAPTVILNNAPAGTEAEVRHRPDGTIEIDLIRALDEAQADRFGQRGASARALERGYGLNPVSGMPRRRR